MREVTMVVLRVVQVVEPLLQLAPTAYLHRRQLRQLVGDGRQQGVGVTNDLSSLQYTGVQFCHYLVVHGHTSVQR